MATTVETFASVTGEWKLLAAEIEAAPFLEPGWFGAWWTAFGRGTLRVLVVRRHAHLVGLTPVHVARGVWQAPANAHTPWFDVLAVDEEARHELIRALVAAKPRELRLGPLPLDGPTFRLLQAEATAAGYCTLVRRRGRAPYVPLRHDLGALERAFSSNLRHDVRRRLRRLCEAGAVCVEVSEDVASLEEGLDVESRSWKGRGGTAIASQPATAVFYSALARWAASSERLRLAFLRLDGRAIAFQFDLEDERAYYSLKIGYDPAYERFAPGKLLTYTMLLRAAARGVPVYELLGTDEPWKARWTAEGRELVFFHAFAPTAAGRLSAWARTRARPLVRRALRR